MTKLLMVCMGNICRSPMAKIVAQRAAIEAQLSGQLIFDSAGTHVSHAGESLDSRAVLSLNRRGYFVGNQRSRQVRLDDFEHYDLILAMDNSNLLALKQRAPPVHWPKLKLLISFAQGLDATEIPDPYYGNAAGFERVLDLCEASVEGLMSPGSRHVIEAAF